MKTADEGKPDAWEQMAKLDKEEQQFREMREKLNADLEAQDPVRVDPEELPPVNGGSMPSSNAAGAGARGGMPSSSGAPPAQQTSGPTASAPPVALEVYEQLFDAVLDDAAFKAVVSAPTLATSQMLEALASNVKALSQGDVGAAQVGRAKFVQAFVTTAAHSMAGPAFDAAPGKATRYVTLKHLGVPEETADVTEGSPATRARRAVYDTVHRGGLKKTFATLCSIIRTNQHLLGGTLEFSVMDESATINRVPVTDAMVGRLREECELSYRIIEKRTGEVGLDFSKETMNDALEVVASERPYHAIQEYLRGLPPWDGVKRLDQVPHELLGAEAALQGGEAEKKKLEARNALARVQVRKTFIAGVARAEDPGSKVDTVLILKGKQGKQKSEWFRRLAPPDRFSDDDIDLHNKDALLLLRKVWILEWSELSVMRSAKDVQTVKGFLSRRTDIFRPPFGARMVQRKRHNIFVGTTNDDGFLSDDTGSRRFWVVEANVEKIDLEKTALWRDQLWAEALVAYKAGEKWWLEDDEDAVRAEVNEEHCAVDPWEEKVVTWLDEQEKVAKAPPKQGVHPAPPVNISVITMSQVFGVLEVPVKNQGKVDERRVGAILRRLGFRRTEKGGHRAWVQTVSLTSSQQPPQAPPIQQPLVVPGQAKPQETDSPTAPPLPPLVLDSQPGGAVAEPASTGTTVGETSSNLEVVSVER